MKHIFLLLLTFLSCAILKAETTPATSYDGGSGTSDDPYQIATLAQLRLLSKTSDDWSSYFVLTADIDATDTETWSAGKGKGFSPIGDSDNYFTGTFDGDGYTIENLYMNNTRETYLGMFGIISAATIKNLGLTNCDMTFYGISAGLVYLAKSSSVIENCYITGTITSSSANVLAGIAGYLINSTIKQCYSDCAVSGYQNVGGLVGIVKGTSNIQDCFVSGDVTGKVSGGLIGQIEKECSATVTNCYVSSEMVNGIICAKYAGTVTDCYYDQTINSVTDGNATGLSTTDFSDKDKFENWDFSQTWGMAVIPDIDSVQRPYLQWMYDYEVTFTLGDNGSSFDGISTQNIAEGKNTQAIKAIGADGYILEEWKDADGNVISSDNPLTITNVTEDMAITAYFEQGYKVYYEAKENGTLSGDTAQEVLPGSSTTEVTAVPAEDYTFKEWQDENGNTISSENPLTLKNITQDMTLVAVFENDESTGINGSADYDKLNIYPNPTQGEVNITLESGVQSANLSVYSLAGKLVYSDPAFAGGKIDLSGLPKGIYLVKINFDGETSIAKLIKGTVSK